MMSDLQRMYAAIVWDLRQRLRRWPTMAQIEYETNGMVLDQHLRKLVREGHAKYRGRGERKRIVLTNPPGLECECGEPKLLWDEGCERCAWLDGRGGSAEIVSALRRMGGSGTYAEIASEIGVKPNSINQMITRHGFGRLRAIRDEKGMVTVYLPEYGLPADAVDSSRAPHLNTFTFADL